jgi:hypothetical protein
MPDERSIAARGQEVGQPAKRCGTAIAGAECGRGHRHNSSCRRRLPTIIGNTTRRNRLFLGQNTTVMDQMNAPVASASSDSTGFEKS